MQVCDFGLSRALSGDFISTTAGIGTPQWAAPEVMRGEKVSEKSDVYSFGVVLWEIVMVESPWKGMRPEQVIFAVGGGRSLHLVSSIIQPEVSNLIKDCWLPQPGNRPSFASIVQRLSKLSELRTALLTSPLTSVDTVSVEATSESSLKCSQTTNSKETSM